MKIKETICTEIDARGRVVKRTRTVDIIDSYPDREDDLEEFGEPSDIHKASTKRIQEAVEDYYRTKEW